MSIAQSSTMPQPIEKLNRVIKKMSGVKTKIPVHRPVMPSESLIFNADNSVVWKMEWMNVYDECRRELQKLRSENEMLTKLVDTEQQKTNKKQQRIIFWRRKYAKPGHKTTKKVNGSNDSNVS